MAVARLLSVTEATYERRAQLEQALQSRVAIEQAKGILAERHGLDVDQAFVLIRRAARANRLKLHDVVRRVRPGGPTPVEVVRELGRLATEESRNLSMPVDRTVERIQHNNRVFRDANERIRDAAEGYSHEVEQLPFLCECPVEDCVEIVRLTPAEYSEVRSDPNHFMTAVGHERAEEPVGFVVARNDEYVVVEKR